MCSLPDIPHQRQADHPPPVESGRLDRCPARVARVPHLAVLALFSLSPGLAAASGNLPEPFYHRLSGALQWRVAAQGETLASLSSRFGVAATSIARLNGLKAGARLQGGEVIAIDNLHIVPTQPGFDLVLNLPQKMLFFFPPHGAAQGYPVALGKPDWPTFNGRFRVLYKESHPAWDVPQSIQEEMRREGKTVKTKVPPGPDNPLGEYWIQLSVPGYGIHGTIAPTSIYRFASHGCIRLHNDDIAALFPQVADGMPGISIYQPVLLAETDDGDIYLEVHPDIYHQGIDPARRARRLIEAAGLEDRVDWTAVRAQLRHPCGTAVLINREEPEENQEETS